MWHTMPTGQFTTVNIYIKQSESVIFNCGTVFSGSWAGLKKTWQDRIKTGSRVQADSNSNNAFHKKRIPLGFHLKVKTSIQDWKKDVMHCAVSTWLLLDNYTGEQYIPHKVDRVYKMNKTLTLWEVCFSWSQKTGFQYDCTWLNTVK